MNNYIRISDLRCPSKDLDCALQELFKKNGLIPAQTPTLSGSFDASTKDLELTVNGTTITINLSGI